MKRKRGCDGVLNDMVAVGLGEFNAQRGNKLELMCGGTEALVFACRICNYVIRINSSCTLLNSVCQLVAHIHVFLVHVVITLQPLQQQLYFHNKKFDGQVFLVQKRHNADNMCLRVPARE